MTKPELRIRMKSIVGAITPTDRTARSDAACRVLIDLPEFARAQAILLFLSIVGEPNTDALVDAAFAADKRVAAPRTNWHARTMVPIELESIDDVVLTDRGIREPRGDTTMPVEQIDLVIVPGVAFDHGGRRLGRGGGFYDRFLAHPRLNALRCGLAFAEQLIEEVPAEPHDATLNLLVTDAGVLRFSQGYRNA